jgi:hypothetical protein
VLVQDGDPSRSHAHQAGIHACVALLASHPELTCVASEERPVPGARCAEHVMHMHAYMHGSGAAADAQQKHSGTGEADGRALSVF